VRRVAGAHAQADGSPSPAVAAQDAAQEQRVAPFADAERYAPGAPEPGVARFPDAEQCAPAAPADCLPWCWAAPEEHYERAVVAPCGSWPS